MKALEALRDEAIATAPGDGDAAKKARDNWISKVTHMHCMVQGFAAATPIHGT